MLAIIDFGATAILLFHTPTKYGSDRFRLRQRYPRDGQLQHIIDTLYRKHRSLQVYTDSFYPKGLAAASYIGRCMGHPPLAMSHLTLYNGQQGRFWYKETATGLRRDVSLSTLDFISLLVKHIPPKGM